MFPEFDHLKNRIMIIDDVPANVAVLDGTLRAIGYENLLGLTDVHSAIQRFDSFEPHLVIIDLHMPSMNGCELMELLRKRLPAGAFLPVMMITADVSDRAKEQAFIAGTNDFLTKPFSLTECALRVRNLLELGHLHRSLQRQNAMLNQRLLDSQQDDREIEEHEREVGRRIDALLRDDGLFMVFQPIVEMSRQELVGVEALARFQQVPVMPPDQWFRDAALVGRGVELELRAAELALRDVDSLPEHAFVSVNLSPAAVRAPRLREIIQQPDRCVIELTEHEPIEDYQPLRDALKPLRAAGLRLALDDTGTGFAGLDRLAQLEPDVIKLDRALIAGVDHERAKQAIVFSMAAFCRSFGATLIAEGVESAEEMDALAALGVTHAQGYFIGRPDDLEHVLPHSAPALSV